MIKPEELREKLRIAAIKLLADPNNPFEQVKKAVEKMKQVRN